MGAQSILCDQILSTLRNWNASFCGYQRGISGLMHLTLPREPANLRAWNTKACSLHNLKMKMQHANTLKAFVGRKVRSVRIAGS